MWQRRLGGDHLDILTTGTPRWRSPGTGSPCPAPAPSRVAGVAAVMAAGFECDHVPVVHLDGQSYRLRAHQAAAETLRAGVTR